MSRTFCCAQMEYAIDAYEIPLVEKPQYREIGIEIHDGGVSTLRLHFCPFCGARLPISLRRRWIEELNKLGIDPSKDEIPPKFQGSEWYVEQPGETAPEEHPQ